MTVLQSSFIAEKTLGYRQEIIIGPIMIFRLPCINSCSPHQKYIVCGVSEESTRLHISVHKYLFSFESGYFPFSRTLL